MTLDVDCPRRRVTRLAVAAATVALAGSLLAGPGRAGVSSVAACSPHTTVVWLESRGEPGAGSVYYTVGLTNLSQRSCSLHGYPGVSAIDVTGQQLGSAAGRNARFPVQTIVLAPGASGRFLLQVNEPGFFPKTACGAAARAAALRIFLPGATTSSVVPVPLGACSRTGPVFLHATAVTT